MSCPEYQDFEAEGGNRRGNPREVLTAGQQPHRGAAGTEGAEAVMPDLMDFLLYCFYNSNFKAANLGGKKSSASLCNMGISFWSISARPPAGS